MSDDRNDDALLDLRARAAALGKEGAEGFDAAGFKYVAVLLERLGRPDYLRGEARVRLGARVAERLTALEGRFRAAREEAWSRVDMLASAGVVDMELQAAIERSDYATVVWHAPRMIREAQRPRRPTRPAGQGRSSRSIFRASAAEARAIVAVARAADQLPDAVGPYNGTILAVRALREMVTLSPSYLAAYISRLDDLTALAQLVDPAKKRERPTKRKRN